MKIFDQTFWTGAGVAIATAIPIAYAVLHLWSEWAALILFVYAIYFMGGILWMKHSNILASSFSVGVTLVLLAPLGYWLIHARP